MIYFNQQTGREVALNCQYLKNTGFQKEVTLCSQKSTEGMVTLNRNQKSTEVERIDNFTSKSIPGIGFFLMKMAISQTASCRTILFSAKESVSFYWNLGFRIDTTAGAEVGTEVIKELNKAKREKRNAIVPYGLYLYLPKPVRKQWQYFLFCDAILQVYLQNRQRPLQIIAEYLNLGGDEFALAPSIKALSKSNHYFFKTRNGQDLPVEYTENPNGGILHHVDDDCLKYGTIDSNGKRIKDLENRIVSIDHPEIVLGGSFFLVKRALERYFPFPQALSPSHRLFFYYRLGFRLNPKMANYSNVKFHIPTLIKSFEKAQKENQNPTCDCLVAFESTKMWLVLTEVASSYWQRIIKSDPLLQDHLGRHQKPIQLIQEYLLPPISE